MPASIFDRRLIVVTGKGGVGKSTTAAALALCAARRGLKVLVCEVTSKERVAQLLGHAPVGDHLTELEPGLFVVNVVPESAMHEYALMKLKFETIYKAVFENRLVRSFLKMIPSLAETVMLGKVWFEVEAMEGDRPRWDVVILDAPATGHGISFLRVPQTLLDTIPAGAMREDAEKMYETLTDPKKTSLQLVSLPEEMPVNETIELDATIRDALGIPRGIVFLNAFVPTVFEPEEAEQLEGLALEDGPLTPARAAASGAQLQISRARMSARYREKLGVELSDLPLITLPRLYSATWGRAEIDQLAERIEETFAVTEVTP